MDLVNLVSGGLDSTLIGVMAKEEGVQTFPLFIDYGQRARKKEWTVCRRVHEALRLQAPTKMDVSGYGKVILSGLTSNELDVRACAFTPGRNLLFLVLGAAYAFQVGASKVAIGLLTEQLSIFPDQRSAFVRSAERTIEMALGKRVEIVTPLSDFTKADVVQLASEKGISGTYSCHVGGNQPCGDCVSCLEFGSRKGG